MVGLEVWLLAAAVAAARPGPDGNVSPPIELLEFIGDWTAEEQKLIDQVARPKKKSVKPQSKKKDVSNESTSTRNGPPR